MMLKFECRYSHSDRDVTEFTLYWHSLSSGSLSRRVRSLAAAALPIWKWLELEYSSLDQRTQGIQVPWLRPAQY